MQSATRNVIGVYDNAGNVIETHEHGREFKETIASDSAS
jgi:hypothetical protein